MMVSGLCDAHLHISESDHGDQNKQSTRNPSMNWPDDNPLEHSGGNFLEVVC